MGTLETIKHYKDRNGHSSHLTRLQIYSFYEESANFNHGK